MEKSIYDLDLHEVSMVETDDRYLFTTAMRVVGGWIYRSYDKSHSMMAAVFVPYNQDIHVGSVDNSEKAPTAEVNGE